MKGFRKGCNIGFIFTLIWVIVFPDFTYASDTSLRTPLFFSNREHKDLPSELVMFIEYVKKLQREKNISLLNDKHELLKTIMPEDGRNFPPFYNSIYYDNIQWQGDLEGGVWIWHVGSSTSISEYIYLYISPEGKIEEKTLLETLDVIVDCKDLETLDSEVDTLNVTEKELKNFLKGKIGIISVKNKVSQKPIGYLRYVKNLHFDPNIKAVMIEEEGFRIWGEYFWLNNNRKKIIFTAILQKIKNLFDSIDLSKKINTETGGLLESIGFYETKDIVRWSNDKISELDPFIPIDKLEHYTKSSKADSFITPYEASSILKGVDYYPYLLQDRHDEALIKIIETVLFSPRTTALKIIKEPIEHLKKVKYKYVGKKIADKFIELIEQDNGSGVVQYMSELLEEKEEIKGFFEKLELADHTEYHVYRIANYIPIAYFSPIDTKDIYISERYEHIFAALPLPLQKEWADYMMQDLGCQDVVPLEKKNPALSAIIHITSCLYDFLGEWVDLKEWLRENNGSYRSRLDFLMRLALIVDTAKHMPLKESEQLEKAIDIIRSRHKKGTLEVTDACSVNIERSLISAADAIKDLTALSILYVNIRQGGFRGFFQHKFTAQEIKTAEGGFKRINPEAISNEPGRGHLPVRSTRDLEKEDILDADIFIGADLSHRLLATALSGDLKGAAYTLGQLYSFFISEEQQKGLRFLLGKELQEAGEGHIHEIFTEEWVQNVKGRTPTSEDPNHEMVPYRQLKEYVNLLTDLGPVSLIIASHLKDGKIEELSELPKMMYRLMKEYKMIQKSSNEITNGEVKVRSIKEKADTTNYDYKNAPQFIFTAKDIMNNFPGFFEAWSNWPATNIKICYDNEEEHGMLLDLGMIDFLPLRIQLISKAELSGFPRDKTHLVEFRELGQDRILAWPKVFVYMAGVMDIEAGDTTAVPDDFSVEIGKEMKNTYMERISKLCEKVRENVRERIKRGIPFVDLKALYRYSSEETTDSQTLIKRKLARRTSIQL